MTQPSTKTRSRPALQVGDLVVYPHHGAGRIVEISTQTVLGERQEYLIILIDHSEMTLKVPAAHAWQSGLRRVVDRAAARQVLEVLCSSEPREELHWNHRLKRNRARLRSGEILQLAAVVRELELLAQERPLAGNDRRMLAQAKRALASELQFPLGCEVEAAELAVAEACSGDLRAWQPVLAPGKAGAPEAQ